MEHFYFRNHFCITFSLLSVNLYEYIKNNNFSGFSLNRIRRFAVQILQALSFLMQQRIIHCDLKPENILLEHPSKYAIQVIDFGSSCFDNERGTNSGLFLFFSLSVCRVEPFYVVCVLFVCLFGLCRL